MALFGTANLLLLAAGAVMGALVLLLSITRTFADHLSAPAPSRSTQARSSSADLLKVGSVLSLRWRERTRRSQLLVQVQRVWLLRLSSTVSDTR